jgi:hypothetical protein
MAARHLRQPRLKRELELGGDVSRSGLVTVYVSLRLARSGYNKDKVVSAILGMPPQARSDDMDTGLPNQLDIVRQPLF